MDKKEALLVTNWRFKTDRNGEPTTAVMRRMKKLGTSDLSTPEGRREFGYNFLEWVPTDE